MSSAPARWRTRSRPRRISVLAYDVTPLVQAAYSLGVWNNVQTSNPQSYLTSTATGAPTFGGIAGFASNKYSWDQTHLSNAVSLKSDTKGRFRLRPLGLHL